MQALGVSGIELIEGGGGVFEIEVDGALKFSKRACGRFPNDAELEDIAQLNR